MGPRRRSPRSQRSIPAAPAPPSGLRPRSAPGSPHAWYSPLPLHQWGGAGRGVERSPLQISGNGTAPTAASRGLMGVVVSLAGRGGNGRAERGQRSKKKSKNVVSSQANVFITQRHSAHGFCRLSQAQDLLPVAVCFLSPGTTVVSGGGDHSLTRQPRHLPAAAAAPSPLHPRGGLPAAGAGPEVAAAARPNSVAPRLARGPSVTGRRQRLSTHLVSSRLASPRLVSSRFFFSGRFAARPRRPPGAAATCRTWGTGSEASL